MVTKDREFHRRFWPLLGMLVVHHLITLSVNLLDNVMLGGYAESALAGASAANQIFFLLQQVVNGVCDGLLVLTSQYWGQKRTEPIQRLAATALWLALGIALLVFGAAVTAPLACMRLFTPDAAIAAEGAAYLRIVGWSYPVYALSAVLLTMLRSVETVRVAVVVSVTALCNNALLNYMLIYGKLGAPELGVRGAAIATLTARLLELGIVVAYLVFVDRKLKVRPGLLLRPDRTLTQDYFRVSIPTIIIGLQWGLNVALQTVILGHMAANAIAANAIAVNLVMLLKVVAIGAASAAGITIGMAVGRGEMDKIREYTRSLQLIFLGFGVVICAGILLLRTPVLSLYRITPETKALARSFLGVLAFTSMGMAYQMPVLTGIVRGGGDTRFVMINDMVSVWCIVIPLSFLAAFVFGWPPVAVIACLHSDQVFKCVPAVFKVNSYNWVRRLTRSESE